MMISCLRSGCSCSRNLILGGPAYQREVGHPGRCGSDSERHGVNREFHVPSQPKPGLRLQSSRAQKAMFFCSVVYECIGQKAVDKRNVPMTCNPLALKAGRGLALCTSVGGPEGWRVGGLEG